MSALPNDELAERALLGDILNRGKIPKTVNGLAPGDFYQIAHETIWAAMRSLSDQGKPCDLPSVMAYLDKLGQLERGKAQHSSRKVTDLGLIELQQAAPIVDPAHIAANIREHARRRQLIQLHQRGLQQAHDPTSDPEEMLRQLGLIPGKPHDPTLALAEDVEREVRRIRVREAAQRKIRSEQQRDLGNLEPIRLTDFLAIPDEIIQYRIDSLWPSGSRVVLAAQFKAGKTTLTSNAVRSLADADPFLDRFSTMPARVTLVDFEMDPSKVRQWLRDQQIRNTDNVSVIPLRGKVSSFDILDPRIRSEWAARIRGHDVAIFDCLRPILDSLGLDENRDAGRLLSALYELLNEAEVPEALLVHHMGHIGERSRGDSRIIDWPDATWKLVREDAENENSPRYFSAYGRDVFRAESLLAYDRETRRLSLRSGNRKDAANERLCPPLLDLLRAHPDGMSGRRLDDAMVDAGHGRNAARNARTYAVQRLYVTTRAGEKRAVIHKINPDLPE